MAKVLGESGRYVTEEAVRKIRQIWTLGFVVVALMSAIWGFMASLLLRNGKIPAHIVTLVALILGLAIWMLWKWSDRKLNTLERERMQMRKGATGETVVAITLGDLPEGYRVIHDLTTPSGNLDHVVIGPTGVFIIETKNWRGVVAADGNEELMLNGKPTDKRCVSQLIGRMMGTRDEIKLLAPDLNPYFLALFVFTSARVDANWGTTGKALCLRDNQLFDFIVDEKRNKKLTRQEVDILAQAFLKLARKDAGFCESEAGTSGQTVPSGQIKLAPAHIHKGI